MTKCITEMFFNTSTILLHLQHFNQLNLCPGDCPELSFCCFCCWCPWINQDKQPTLTRSLVTFCDVAMQGICSVPPSWDFPMCLSHFAIKTRRQFYQFMVNYWCCGKLTSHILLNADQPALFLELWKLWTLVMT